MKLRRGFVRESEEYALEFRAELGLDPTAPLPARVLAEHLNVPVLELSKLGSLPPVMAMRVVRPGGTFFFGAIIPDGTFRAILHNDFVAPNRQSSDIMHELAHIILGHPVYPLMGLSGARIYNPTYENEAKELSFALMKSIL